MKTITRVAPREVTDRVTVHETTLHGRRVVRGTELTIVGIRGRCAFLARTKHENGAEWVDVINSRGGSRTVRPEMIKTVHRRVVALGGR